MIRRFIPIFFLVVIIFIPVSSFSLDFEPGEYEITSTMEMPGMTMPPQTITQCLTQDEPVPSESMGESGCEISDMKTDGDTITWTMECSQQGQKVTTEGEMTYSGDTFEGVMTTKMGPQAGNMTLKTLISGKRIGSCE